MVWLVVLHISVWGHQAQLYPEQRTAFSNQRSCVGSIPPIRAAWQGRSPVNLDRITCERFRLRR